MITNKEYINKISKTVLAILASISIALLATACQDNQQENGGFIQERRQLSVDEVIASRAQEEAEGASGEDLLQESKATEPKHFNFVKNPQGGEYAKDGIDFDLSDMNKDVVFALVYQMMNKPEDYIGKTFRMQGLYYANYFEPHDRYYSFCIIEDALACCAQGILFELEDESKTYPEDFPEDYSRVIIEGTFEGLELPEEDRTQYRLLTNKMDVISPPEEGGFRFPEQ